jgi:hypothetical protein
MKLAHPTSLTDWPGVADPACSLVIHSVRASLYPNSLKHQHTGPGTKFFAKVTSGFVNLELVVVCEIGACRYVLGPADVDIGQLRLGNGKCVSV